MVTYNQTSPEWILFVGLIEAQILTHRKKMENEATPAEDLPLLRAKIAGLTSVKKKAEEACNADREQ